jgi:anti-sigma factor RsiW
MQKRNDDRLVAYLDDEVDASARREIEDWLDSDPAARDKLAALAQSDALVRSAFDEVMHEAVPERLIAAARGERVSAEPIAKILPFKRGRAAGGALAARSWWLGLPLAASLFGLLLGGAVAYLSAAQLLPGGLGGKQPAVEMAAADNLWLDNAVGYFKLAASAGDGALVDVPATGDAREAWQKISQSLPQPQEVRWPDLNLKPWGLNFRGARLVVADGRPAAQLMYTTDNKAIGPLTLIIGSSKEADTPPTLARRQDVNLLYWRHQGRAYALVGQTDVGYLWGIANDVAWQLDAI